LKINLELREANTVFPRLLPHRRSELRHSDEYMGMWDSRTGFSRSSSLRGKATNEEFCLQITHDSSLPLEGKRYNDNEVNFSYHNPEGFPLL
jgi:hypothetical protein